MVPGDDLPPVAAPDGAPGVAAAAGRNRTVEREYATGLLLGVISAVSYTGTNVALRGMTRDGDVDWAIWVTAFKSLPGAVAAWAIVAWRASRGLPAMPTARAVGWLLAVGFLVQFGGNLLFQWSLAMCGLARAVPTVFATLMLTGALLGWIWLREAVSTRSAVAMGLLMAAIGLLATVTPSTDAGLPKAPAGVSPAAWVVGGIVFAGLSGVFYGGLGVLIREVSRGKIPLSATLALISTTGVVGLGLTAWLRMGPGVFQATSGEWMLLALSGVLNAAAFFAISGALQRVPVVQTNLLNASQAALCAIAGVLLYHEPLTAALAGGTVLTIAGLVMMGRGNGK